MKQLATMVVLILLSLQGCYVEPGYDVYDGGGVGCEPPPIVLEAAPGQVVLQQERCSDRLSVTVRRAH